MDSDNNDETTESSSSSESPETLPRAKVRYLQPEKDPMGAGTKAPARTPNPDSARPA